MTDRERTSTDQWRLEQSSTIGGSSAAAVLGRARFKTTGEYWQRLRAARVDHEVPPSRTSDDMRRGTILEPIALQEFSEMLGVPIQRHDQNDFVYNKLYPWAHSLPDGWCGDDLVEVKVPRPATVMRCNLEGLFAEWTIQAQHNMAVCTTPARRPVRCRLGILDPMSCVCHAFVIPRDDVFISAIMRDECNFYQSVLDNKPPPDEVAKSLEPDYSKADWLFLDDEESVGLAEAWLRLKAIETDLKESLKLTRGRIEQKMGDKAVAEIGTIARVHWKTSKASRRLDKATVLAKHPEIETDDAYWKTSKPSRPFRVYPLGKS